MRVSGVTPLGDRLMPLSATIVLDFFDLVQIGDEDKEILVEQFKIKTENDDLTEAQIQESKIVRVGIAGISFLLMFELFAV